MDSSFFSKLSEHFLKGYQWYDSLLVDDNSSILTELKQIAHKIDCFIMLKNDNVKITGHV